jgi:hemerythrin-like metal-binding protein
MTKIEWNVAYDTGIDRIDFQHQNLLGMLNATIVASESDPSFRAEAVRLCLDQVVNYTGYHFETEEGLMEKAGYPDIENHKKEHIALKLRVEKYVAVVEKGDISQIGEILEFLRNWLINHIGESDHTYIPYVLKLQD